MVPGVEISRTFMLIFTTIIWKRIWIIVAIYCRCKKIQISRKEIYKVLNYTIFSESGLANKLKIYILKALDDGFLMPHFHKDNIYVSQAIHMFKDGYNVVIKNGSEKEFIIKHALNVFDSDEDLNNERDDIIKNFNNQTKLCNILDDWDIDPRLLYSNDDYKNIIMNTLILL